MNEHIKNLADAKTLLNDAMNNVVGDYATRVAFAWDRLSITDGAERMIPAEEMAERMSKVLGRVVSKEKFLQLCETLSGDRAVLEALARVLGVEVEVGWITC